MRGSSETLSSNDPATSGLRRLFTSAIDLARAWYLVAKVLVPIAVLSALGLLILHLLYLRNPARTDVIRSLSIDHLIVLEQIKRASTLPQAEIAFFGDSSCLMGIDPVAMERTLDLRPIQSFCTLAYHGPAGYARMLAGMIERNAAPKVLVLMFHPTAFQPVPGWEYWPAFGQNAGKVDKPSLSFPRSSLDYLEFEGLSSLIYSPLPGAYGLYYGGEGAFRSTIRELQGGAIDPNSGLNVSSLRDVRPVPTPPSGEPADFNWNQRYVGDLKTLAETIARLPLQTSTYLVVSPVPDYMFRAESKAQRAERARQIAATLGIAADHILNTPETMSVAFVSGYTHLNRWGKAVFTDALAKEIAARR